MRFLIKLGHLINKCGSRDKIPHNLAHCATCMVMMYCVLECFQSLIVSESNAEKTLINEREQPGHPGMHLANLVSHQ